MWPLGAVFVEVLYQLQGFSLMSTDVSLDKMSVAEKLILMERLWDDLTRSPAHVPSPDWHGDVLAERIAAVREGRTEFVDWDPAKQRLRDRLQ
jgi:putative addiction module component (TIGR02574 family)